MASSSTSSFTSQTKLEMESSKARHWSELKESVTSSEWSAETNYAYFAELKNNPEWGRFLYDLRELKVGEKISGGAQADVYEASMFGGPTFDMVVKVMKGDASLQALQAQWPIGMLSARSKYKRLFDVIMKTIVGGTLLHDERLKGRFAFVMYRRWGDLRLLIDRRMKVRRSSRGPFSIEQAIHMMLSIASDMDILHTKYDIIHRDLKASNVLVWKGYGKEMKFSDDETLYAVVADFECSGLILGTGFWKAPEIFQQLKDGVPSSEVKFTTMSDVYSFGMTCYEILSGSTPFDLEFDNSTREEVLSGRRPYLSSDIPLFLRSIITSCWHANPEERPSFHDICESLNRWPQVVIDNEVQNDATVIKIRQQKKFEHYTLLHAMERLVCMKLSILITTTSIALDMVEYYLEVSYYEGGKVCDTNVIANIEKVLSSPLKTRWVDAKPSAKPTWESIIYRDYVIEISGLEEPLLLEVFGTILSKMEYTIDKAKCWTYNDRLECVMFLSGREESSLLTRILENLLRNLPSVPVYYNIVLHKLAFKETYDYVQNFKPVNISVPPNYKESGIDTRLLEQGWSLPARDFKVKSRKREDGDDVASTRVKVVSIIPPSLYCLEDSDWRRLLHDVRKGKLKLTLEHGLQQLYCHSRGIEINKNFLGWEKTHTSSVHGSTKKKQKPFVFIVV